MDKINLIETSQLNLVDDFKELLENKTKTSSYSSNSSWNSEKYKNREFTCFFYEWSSLHMGTKTFYNVADLKKFLDECKIEYTEQQMGRMKNGGMSQYWYVSCIPNAARLLTFTSYDDLKDALLRYHQQNGTEMKKKEYNHFQYPYCGGYGRYPYYHSYDEYHDWD